MGCQRKVITLVILASLLNVALSQTGVVVGKDIYKWSIFPIIQVIVTNELDGMVLHLNCQSSTSKSNSKTGYHIKFLPWATIRIADFTRNLWLWGETEHYCIFSFGGEKHTFTIYKDSRDNVPGYQCQHCLWTVRRNGVCALDSRTGKYDICYSWDK
ncbi:hypothetical protein CARUB_v10019365mg [Capsella rubella]|uniref:Uncharacterized protein n=1 Tax=Capsella rubella TaxID=81985 RepID=R0FTZ9_9BRAS|nr:hypothetical protein CARUB_v10019365mg [Capsella rubella]